MKLTQTFHELKPIGEVPSKKTTYHVFENPKAKSFVLLNMKKGGDRGYFNIIKRSLSDLVYKHIKGKQVHTINHIKGLRKLEPHFRKNKFIPLNCLYVLVALKKAKIDLKHKGAGLYFTVH